MYDEAAVNCDIPETEEEVIVNEESQDAMEEASRDLFAVGNMLLDTYRIDSEPVEGTSVVRKVHHMFWDTDLAMKLPKEDSFSSEEEKESFADECEPWTLLGLHPNVAACYYVRDIEGEPAIFTEWMEEGSLSDRIEDRSLYEGKQTEIEERLLDVAVQSLRGLSYILEKGLVHQGLKLSNIMFTEGWSAKICDIISFGHAEHNEDEEPGKYTNLHDWAMIVKEMYGKTSKAYPPEEMKEILEKCLSSDPEERPKDLGEIEEKLTDIYVELCGRTYSRVKPGEGDYAAGTLSNRALTYLDLGKEYLAETYLDKAVSLDPYCVEAVVDQSIFLWRKGRLNDRDFYERISTLRRCDEYSVISEAFFKERGSTETTLTYPNPVTSEIREGVLGRTSSVRLDGEVISFVVRHNNGAGYFNYVLRFDLLTGSLVERYPGINEEPVIPYLQNESYNILTEDASSMFISWAGGEATLWDVKNQTLIAEYDASTGFPTEFVMKSPYSPARTADGIDVYNHLGKQLCSDLGKQRLQTLDIPLVPHFRNQLEKDQYPELIMDPDGNRLVLYQKNSTVPFWYLIDMPHLSGYRMPYYIARPVSKAESDDTASRHRQCYSRFFAALGRFDLEEMVYEYEAVRELPAMQGEDILLAMNRALVKMCYPIGLHGIHAYMDANPYTEEEETFYITREDAKPPSKGSVYYLNNRFRKERIPIYSYDSSWHAGSALSKDGKLACFWFDGENSFTIHYSATGQDYMLDLTGDFFKDICLISDIKISADGRRILIISRDGKAYDSLTQISLCDFDNDVWELIYYGPTKSLSKCIPTDDMEYVMVYDLGGNKRSASLLMFRRGYIEPVFEVSDPDGIYASVERFSEDMCGLLDAKGNMIHALEWAYT